MKTLKKYEQGAEYIVREVISALKPGDKLPSEILLAERAGVSLMTIRQSIRLLTEHGFIVRRPQCRPVVAELRPRQIYTGVARKILMVRMQEDIAYTELMMLIQQAMLQSSSGIRYNPVPFYMPFFQTSTHELEHKTIETLLQLVTETQCHAVLLLPGIDFEQKIQRELNKLNIPLLVYLPRAPLDNYFYINLGAGAYTALQHLHQIGCRHIRYIGSVRDYFWTQYSGVKRFFQEYYPKSDPHERIVPCLGTIEDGYEAFSRLLKNKEKVDGILAHDDSCAIGVSMAARRYGIKIPRQLAVVGSDDLEHTHKIYPQLTSLALPNKQLAEEIVKSLDHIFSNPGIKVSNRVELHPQLHIRKSTSGFKGK